jgi:ornithine cyclodeaminase
MLILNAAEVSRALPMEEAISAMKGAFQALTEGEVILPLRSQLTLDEKEANVLLMPAYLRADGGGTLGVKTISVFPENIEQGLPLLHAAVLVLDENTGAVRALLEGGRLTAVRTGAASGAATDLLARETCRVGAVFGAGVQSRSQLEAVCTVRNLEQVWVYDPNQNRTEAFIRDLAGRGPIPEDVRPAVSPAQAAAEADLICTATTSKEPVFKAVDLKPGVHINGVGSFTPEMVEVPPELVKAGSVFVDSREGVLEESGEVLAAVRQDLIDEEDLVELGEVLAGQSPGRVGPGQITFFKSVGIAVQDAAAAGLALKKAEELGIGQWVDW